MALQLDQKKKVVADITEIASKAFSVIAAEYAGLSVDQMTELRAQARQANVVVKVVKNSLAKRAFEKTDYACMTEKLVGPLVLVFSQEDPGSAARVIVDFAKSNEKLLVKLVALDGKLLEPSEINRLAKLPTKDQAISLLLAVLKAPVTKLVRTLVEPHAKLVRTIAAIGEQKKAS